VGHGETYLDPEDVLWWSKGGTLHGESPDRIAFLRQIIEEGPDKQIEPTDFGWDVTCLGRKKDYFLVYFGIHRPAIRHLFLPKENEYQIEIIDTWEMAITSLKGTFNGQCAIELPGKPYMALRIRKKAF
jgi:hypothetical protein